MNENGRVRVFRAIVLPLGILVLLSVHWALAVSSSRRKSQTFDEVIHLIGGVSLLKTGDYRLDPENPPLAHVWAASAVVLSGASFPDSLRNYDGWWHSSQWDVGLRFLYRCGNHPQSIMTRGRAMIALLSVALGLVVYLWSRRLFGGTGAAISLLLYCFCPNMLAHAGLVTTDLATALFFPLASGGVWWVLRRITPLSVGLSALATAGLFLTKMSGPILLPIIAVLVLVRLISNRPTVVGWRRPWILSSRAGQLGAWALAGLVHGAIVVLVIWAAYGFRYAAMKDARPGRDRLPPGLPSWGHGLGELGRVGTVISWAADNRVLPEAYLFGLAYTLRHAQPRPAFLNGQTRLGGWWYYFPYCFAVKTPLPFIALLLLAVFAGLAPCSPGGDVSRPADSRYRAMMEGLYRCAPLWALFVVYWVIALNSSLQIGHRHEWHCRAVKRC